MASIEAHGAGSGDGDALARVDFAQVVQQVGIGLTAQAAIPFGHTGLLAEGQITQKTQW
jgi:hypothetical protein